MPGQSFVPSEAGEANVDAVMSSSNGEIMYGALKQLDVPKRSLASLRTITMCILVVELCERLAFYTFTGTQEFFLERHGYSLSQAGGVNAAMGTLCMAWALFAGWMADVVLGRYHTIMVFGILYAIGALVAATAAWPAFNDTGLYLFGVMALIPIGTAGIKANISNFGADQFDTSDPAQKDAQEKFFSWFYLAINLGSAVAYGCLTTVGANGGFGVPKLYGYFSVYAIAAGCMFLAVCLFISCSAQYKRQPVLSRSAASAVANYLLDAAQKGSGCAIAVCVGMVMLGLGIVFSVVLALFPQSAFATLNTWIAFFCSFFGVLAVAVPCLDTTWLGEARLSGETLSGSEVRDFLRILPVLFTGNLAFSALYNSMQFWYQQQACQMDLRMSGESQVAGSFFMIADCLGIVIATPLAIGWFNPAMEARFRKMGTTFGHGAKYGLGIFFGMLSVFAAVRLEQTRKGATLLEGTSNCAPEGVQMSNMSAVWMVLPFFLMGLGEIYTQPVLMHLAYTQSPPAMRTLAAVAALLIGAVSTALFTVQIAALSPFIPNDLNQGHLEYGYISNIILGGAFYVVFLGSLRFFKEKTYNA